MSLAYADLAFLRDLVANQSGHVITSRHAEGLEQRLLPVACTAGLDGVTSLVQQLRHADDCNLSSQVAQAVTVNETSFFRDSHVFETLRTKVLPKVIARNAQRQEICVWCAACSSGQEPYSIAMLLREHFPALANWKLRIVASDLCDRMLQRVRAGTYSQLEISQGLPAKKIIRFFQRRGARWQAKSELREMVDVHQINLTRRWPYLGQFDIVLARNVLMYFDQHTKQDILKRMRGAMRPDGYLFVGAAETLVGLCVPYQRVEMDDAVCYRPAAI